VTAFAGLVESPGAMKTVGQIAAPTIGPQHAPSSDELKRECEWKPGQDELQSKTKEGAATAAPLD